MTDVSLEARVLNLEKEVLELVAKRTAMRDVVARLLAYLAISEDDPEELLRHFSTSGDIRIDQPGLSTAQLLPFAEEARREKDWIVAAAREMIAD
jgi:hypothetical protein